MAYDGSKPANDEFLADFPPEMREQLRAIVQDQIVNALRLCGLSPGNGNGNIPVSNGNLNTNLNAEKLGGQYSSAFAAAGHGHSVATGSSNGFMSNSDKAKMDTIATSAEVNQNAFSNVSVNGSVIQADNKTDTLTLEAGANITLTPDVTNDKVNIAVAGTVPTANHAEYISNESVWMRFHWAGQAGQPTWLWGGNDAANMYVYNPSNFSVSYAKNADNAAFSNTVSGHYTGNGGQQSPNYFGKNRVGFLMMNTSINGNANYKNFLIMDNYDNDDVGGATALGLDRQANRAFIMRSNADRTAWNESAELITSAIIGQQSVNYATTAGNANAVNGHVFNWSGQGGQPTWLWGGTDPSNMYVYNPSNFSVSYANLVNPLSGDSNYKLGYTADGQRTNAGEWGRVVMRYVPNGQTYGVRVDRADSADVVGGYTVAQLIAAAGGIVAQSFSANGFVKFSSGCILQWGRLVGGSNSFPIQFSNAGLRMITSFPAAWHASASNTTLFSLSPTGFIMDDFYSGSSNKQPSDYIAIGY